MSAVDRRKFLTLAGAGAAAAAGADETDHREQFLWPRNQTYLNSAGLHPISRATRSAIDRYLDYQYEGPGPRS